jgi:hypothetical protein
MKNPISALSIGLGLLALSAGVALATDLHNPANTMGFTTTPLQGQTGSNVLSNCGAAPGTALGAGAKSNTGVGSPIGPNANSKAYAGNAGNPTFPGSTTISAGNAILNSNRSKDVSFAQYDNSCAQAQVH